MISYYKGQFLDSKSININEKLFRGIGVFETIKFLNNKMLCNPTRQRTVRLRPNLCVSSEEVDHALSIISKVAKKIWK